MVGIGCDLANSFRWLLPTLGAPTQRAVFSAEPVNSVSPTTCRHQTVSPWPSYVRSSSPLDADHARTVLSVEPEYSMSPTTCRQ